VDIGPSELIIILLIVVVLFGVGRLGKIGGELGSAIREFRKGLSGDEQPEKDAKSTADSKDSGAQHP
jgi:sec-independent protein translocase protein TatA